MSTWEFPGRYDFSIPEAQWLSDLYGIDYDLGEVIRICNGCEKIMSELFSPQCERDAEWFEECQMLGDLTFTAVVRYGRTLNSGVRSGIPAEWILNLPEALQKSHVYFKALRDKYIAHSVSQLEDNQIFVILTPQIGENQVPGHITVERGRLITLSSEQIKCLSELSTALQEKIAEEVKLESDRLLEIARNMPIEEIKSRKTESTKTPGNHETYKVRKKW